MRIRRVCINGSSFIPQRYHSQMVDTQSQPWDSYLTLPQIRFIPTADHSVSAARAQSHGLSGPSFAISRSVMHLGANRIISNHFKPRLFHSHAFPNSDSSKNTTNSHSSIYPARRSCPTSTFSATRSNGIL
jgi:hypothetical protein